MSQTSDAVDEKLKKNLDDLAKNHMEIMDHFEKMSHAMNGQAEPDFKGFFLQFIALGSALVAARFLLIEAGARFAEDTGPGDSPAQQAGVN